MPVEVDELAENSTGNVIETAHLIGGSSGNLMRAFDAVLGAFAGSVTLEGMDGNDSLEGGGFSDLLDGGSGNDTLAAGTGNDTYRFTGGDDTLTEGSASDTEVLDFSFFNGTVQVDISRGDRQQVNPGDFVTLGDPLKWENVTGSGANDSIIGNYLNNLILGGNGNDSMVGGEGNDTLDGGGDNDTLAGGAGDDRYIGGPGTDRLVQTAGGTQELDSNNLKGEGNDTLVGTTLDIEEASLTGASGADLINAINFPGATTLVGAQADDILKGGSGPSSMDGGSGNDSLVGKGGKDTLVGGDGSDTLLGGTGSDYYVFDPVQVAGPVPEHDIIEEAESPGTDVDTITFANLDATTPVTVNLETPFLCGSITVDLACHANRAISMQATSPAAIDQVVGGPGNDVITGSSAAGSNGAERLEGGPGNDNLSGSDRDDTLVGGDGNDTLAGGRDNDTYLFADVSAAAPVETDQLSELAGQGNDILDFRDLSATVAVTVELGSTTTVASHTKRTVMAQGGTIVEIETVVGGNGNDSITGNGSAERLEGGPGHDTLVGGEGNDTMLGGVGNDTYKFAEAFANQNDVVTELLNEGDDSLDFSLLPSNKAVTARLNKSSSIATHMKRTVNSTNAFTIETVIGGAGDDSLTGSNPDSPSMTTGRNRLVGNGGKDTLNGLDGDDTLEGGSGDDVYVFAEPVQTTQQTDTIFEGSGQGNDTLDFSSAKKSIRVDLLITSGMALHDSRTINGSNASGGTLIAALETVIGGSGNDVIRGNNLANRLEGQDGKDRLEDRGGKDTLDGGKGDDVLFINAVDGEEDSLIGGKGTDIALGVKEFVIGGVQDKLSGIEQDDRR